jgi:hypothetical protein
MHRGNDRSIPLGAMVITPRRGDVSEPGAAVRLDQLHLEHQVELLSWPT